VCVCLKIIFSIWIDYFLLFLKNLLLYSVEIFDRRFFMWKNVQARLYIAVSSFMVFSCLLGSVCLAMTSEDIQDTITALNSLGIANAGMWTANRSGLTTQQIRNNSTDATLQGHLFNDHNGGMINGEHTAIRRGTPPQTCANATQISGIVAVAINAITGAGADNYVRTHAQKTHMGGMRRVVINLQPLNNVAVNRIQVQTVTTQNGRQNSQNLRSPTYLEIDLPITTGNNPMARNMQQHYNGNNIVPCSIFFQ
jgi:hypothetical protein